MAFGFGGATEVAHGVVRVGYDDTDVTRGLRRSRGVLRGGMLSLSRITAGVAGAGVASVGMALKFQKAFTNIRALVGASDADIASYKKGVLELAKETGRSPQELAEALYFITSSGFSGAGALRVLKASAMASAAGLGETKVVANAATSAVNAYGEKSLSAARATDILLAAVREGKSEPEELASNIGRVIPSAQNLGVEFGEVAGGMAALSLTGDDAGESVTGLLGIFRAFIKPQAQGQKVLEATGLSFAQIRKEVADKGLLPTLQKLRDRFGDNAEALAKLFPETRGLNAFLSLTGQNAKKNAEIMKEVTGAQGDTLKAFAKAMQDPSNKMGRAWAQIQVRMIQFGSVALPLLGRVADGMEPWVNRLERIGHAIDGIVGATIGWRRAIGWILAGTLAFKLLKVAAAIRASAFWMLLLGKRTKTAAGQMALLDAAAIGGVVPVGGRGRRGGRQRGRPGRAGRAAGGGALAALFFGPEINELEDWLEDKTGNHGIASTSGRDLLRKLRGGGRDPDDYYWDGYQWRLRSKRGPSKRERRRAEGIHDPDSRVFGGGGKSVRRRRDTGGGGGGGPTGLTKAQIDAQLQRNELAAAEAALTGSEADDLRALQAEAQIIRKALTSKRLKLAERIELTRQLAQVDGEIASIRTGQAQRRREAAERRKAEAAERKREAEERRAQMLETPQRILLAAAKARRTKGLTDDIKAAQAERRFLLGRLRMKGLSWREQTDLHNRIADVDERIASLKEDAGKKEKTRAELAAQQTLKFLDLRSSFFDQYGGNIFRPLGGGGDPAGERQFRGKVVHLENHQHFKAPTPDRHREARMARFALQAVFDG